MRYDVKKYLFIGFQGDRDRFFEKAQSLGIIHFIETKSVKTHLVPEDVQDMTAALKILRGLPTAEQEEVKEFAIADGLVTKILQYKQGVEKLSEEERILTLEESRVAIFGDYSLEDIHKIEADTGRKVQFYFSKEGFSEKVTLPDELLYVGTDHGLEYFMALNKTERQFPRMVEMHIQYPIGELTKRHEQVRAELHKSEQRLKSYSKYNSFLQQALIEKLNGYHLHAAEGQVSYEIDGQLFAIEGWIPVNKLEGIEKLVADLHMHAEEIAPEAHDIVPTYLENQGVGQVGEDLVHVYDTPSMTDKDPSWWVLIFFSLFFSLIIGDGGYGLIFLAAALYVKYRYSLNQAGKRVTTLIAILGGACLIWGVLSHAFFGIHPSMDSPLRKVSIIQWLVERKAAYHIQRQDEVWAEWVKEIPALKSISDPKEFLKEGVKEEKGHKIYVVYERFADNVMFELALFIGVVHLSLSLIRNLYRNKVGYGWLLFIVGCYLYFPAFLQSTSMIHYVFGLNKEMAARIGIYLIAGGAALAMFIGFLKHHILGILEPIHGIQIFSDTMSYLRLYALGLAGAMLAIVVNDLAGSTNFVIGALILLLGHTINILIGIMGGIIHGLRLNYLEWYHYSFEGDGKRFDPLRKLVTD
jgi:V/A-type H+/Na+-transporting ATPase subunit I